MKEECPNCKIELKTGYISDVPSGDVLLSAYFEYCKECMYRGHIEITNLST